jgi:hypothetical protein
MFHFGNTLDNAIVKVLAFAMSISPCPDRTPEPMSSQKVYVMTLVRRSFPLGDPSSPAGA